ncbi:MAG: N-6 DNA methylase [Nitrospirae bacterium]|nr:N-6 DNA methylase [Nitrospirota bacterium]
MLDTDTKRRIDTCRDILVGKVPDPKSQVEQITIALIYKFMDDMDAESEEFGGKRKFFAKEFARYGWAKLMRSGLGGHETLNLYAEAIAKMPENPGIPPLFRDIFKNAYLPYRDPETLKMFLKVIDEFKYDHSERLGDAFEYLLSVLGSQGDAGQFRTPRHIIDFMVAIIDPKKTETILDPACGTAGFLISSYKHILQANTDKKGNSKLTPDEKGRLANNFKGYDISPDMVRLSLVNLYLHGFPAPHIYEYDTLASQDRWNDYADVILANPPFMSPKGGIMPHKRFTVQSKRSEVLFVDYMAEHLTPTGRAGIIVPEGIIFQSQTAYKQLRKMLVEEFLVAVVSLPAGVFNPYSGVMTSILILDKSLARKTNTIAFFKVENDGFGLGAQRREIDKNDLHAAVEAIQAFRHSRASGNPDNFDIDKYRNVLVVEKEKIAANGEYNLSGERYSQGKLRSALFPYIPLGEVAIVDWGNTDLTKSSYVGNGQYLGVSAAGCDGRMNHAEHQVGTLVLSAIGANCGRMFFPESEFTAIKNTMTIKPYSDRLEPLYLFHLLSKLTFPKRGGGQPFITKGDVVELQIPVPPQDVQKEIVSEIEGYQKVINGARAVLDNYRPHIPIHSDWPMVRLGDICSLDGTITTDVNLALPYIGADSIESNTGKLLKTETAQGQRVNGPVYEFAGQRLLYSKIRPYLNKLTVVDLHGYCSSDMYPLLPNSAKVQITYLATYMLSDTFNERIRGYYERASIPKINRAHLFGIEIPLPPLTTQQAIVAEIEAEQTLVTANRELITRFEKKIQATLSRVWGEDEPVPAEA